MTETIIQDQRPIMCLSFPDGNAMVVGHKGITTIKPYEEDGEMAHVVWFAVYNDSVIIARVNGKYVQTVHYKK